jgi:hypothetical protein
LFDGEKLRRLIQALLRPNATLQVVDAICVRREFRYAAEQRNLGGRSGDLNSPTAELQRNLSVRFDRIGRQKICLKIRRNYHPICGCVTAVMAGLAIGVATCNDEAQEKETAVTCTNPVSAASWQITIDYRNSTVDSHPAEITRGAISWFDPKDGGNYTLDLRSGDLTGIVASSTGGYFRRARCSLEKSP